MRPNNYEIMTSAVGNALASGLSNQTIIDLMITAKDPTDFDDLVTVAIRFGMSPEDRAHWAHIDSMSLRHASVVDGDDGEEFVPDD